MNTHFGELGEQEWKATWTIKHKKPLESNDSGIEFTLYAKIQIGFPIPSSSHKIKSHNYLKCTKKMALLDIYMN